MSTLPRRRRIGETLGVASSLAGSGAALVAVALLTSSARADVRATTEVTVGADAIEPSRAAALDAPAPPPEIVLEERVQAGRHWRIETARGAVHVWIPADYDAATAATVAFVHGYWIRVDEAWESYRLAEQFALSGINAMFIAPEAPHAKWEPVAWPSLAELVHTVADSVDVAMPARRLVAVGHSGAYRTLALWLTNPALDTVVLLDALYVEYGLLPWMRASRQHRLVNIVYETGRFSDYLHRRLPGTRRVDGLPANHLPDARILYVRTDVGHWQLVTDGVALPLALRAIEVPPVASARLDLPLGLPPRDPPPVDDALAGPPSAAQITEPAY
ncbi:MAG: hypothetical protein E6J90_38535 [Deltaproteobacteria bacterium]|nr:MAG: hypothetical protein E6J90_38535 [Deltaproteobacteria bacterium]